MWDAIFSIPPGQFLTFLIGGLIVNFAPGQDMVFATACGIQGGPRVGAAAGFGAGVGVLWHVTLAALGLSALVAAHPGALSAIKYAGAAYLLYIAWKSWRAGALPQGRGVPSLRRAFLRGVLSNMLNPKPILFFLAFLPQFVNPEAGPVWRQVVLLGLIFAFNGTWTTMLYGWLAGHAGHALGARMAVVNKVAAVLFAGLAARLILTE
ncbi:LysE family translocator [Tabrizicola fusiformis]|uniref:LysE family translocator n=1 Tax=Tabrizicola sp. SY72 TaxID=2741673 RepID=UPI00157341B5|nr:LysE family translocator [Tabrizicola sp. SY72]NTT84545.1 LysE family translocator [Tabrizicola sp. SY72]